MSPASLVDRLVALHLALEEADVPHAFGGALALAWCTERARGTVDIDLNVFVPVDGAERTLEVLPQGVTWGPADLAAIRRDGQVRLWWDTTPVDLFWNTTDFHERAAGRARRRAFAGHDVPFLACDDLAVFKAFFDRTRDWADLEEMQAAGTLDADRVIGVLVRHLGGGDHRVARLAELAGGGP